MPNVKIVKKKVLASKYIMAKGNEYYLVKDTIAIHKQTGIIRGFDAKRNRWVLLNPKNISEKIVNLISVTVSVRVLSKK